MRPTTSKQCTTQPVPAVFGLLDGGAVLKSLCTLLLVALVGVFASLAGGSTPVPTASGNDLSNSEGPINDWLDDLIDDLDDADDSVDNAETIVGEQAGPLSGTDLTAVEADLYDTLAVIDRILDPLQYPSLDPTDAGDIDYSVSPNSLPKYADACLELIEEAVTEARFGAGDDDYIGTRLKTIEHLITRSSPHSFKSLAGVE